jgi:CTP synthase (UTP-ammonia lyase)
LAQNVIQKLPEEETKVISILQKRKIVIMLIGGSCGDCASYPVINALLF